jgi:multidrug efflux pump subunit AcrA (membrane-fusion protein)
LNFIRVRLFTIPGLSTPAPFGGKSRQINVDIDPRLLTARGLSPADVVNALQASNVILPAGTARIGSREYNVLTNGSPNAVSEFAAIPVKVADGTPVLLGDIAHIGDGFADQTNVVRVDGRRASYLAILRHAQASTLAVVDAVKEALPEIKAVAPEGLDLKINFDQSLFVRGAIWSVLREAIISSLLVSLMIGAFLGSWRSMVVVCTSIPLAIFAALIGLKLSGHTINIMTLGGLALAIGMLVDDATVEVENIHRNRSMGKPLTVAILDGASQIAVPAIVATLSICIVFFPVVLLVGPARFLFTPLALAVVLAMLASYLLSRTLVLTLSRFLMAGEHHGMSGHLAQAEAEQPASGERRFAARMNEARERGFARFQELYGRLLERVLVATATTAPPERTLRLQGEVHPFATVTLYGKVAGYLGEMRVDKGDWVRAGQLIATIISPELDYRTLRAPFAGAVTARFADPGALIQSAAGAQAGALPVVTIANTQRLRIYVYLDQASAPFVKIGDAAEVRVVERPGWSRPAKVARASGELTPRTRTMLTEIDVDNADGALLPGSFVEVAIKIQVPSLVQIPAEAVITRGMQPFVAVVGGGSRLRIRPLHLADDDGETARVLDGLRAGETVALHVGESVEDGALVQAVARSGESAAKATASRAAGNEQRAQSK